MLLVEVLKRLNVDTGKLEEFIKFAMVGGTGVFVNMGLLFMLTRYLSVQLEIASPVAIEVSILSNFILNNAWTFSKRDIQVSFWSRLIRYHLVTGLAGVVNYLVLLLLVNLFGLHDLISNLIGITCGMFINFFLNSLWTWKIK